jgi:hypothetical protein
MMRRSRTLSGSILGLWLAASSCTSLREIPRADYNSVPERKGVRVETREGLVYDFDYAAFTGDSLTGYRHRSDVEGPVDQEATFRIALEDIDHLTTRKLDWYRTGLVGGTVLAGVLVAGLSGQAPRPPDSGGGTSGGGGGRIN